MKIGLYNIDSKMPNIALMKISQWHKNQGDAVYWCDPIEYPCFDKIYASSIFTYTDKSYINESIICGGTGFDIKSKLTKEIDDSEQDYSLYPNFKRAIGFLTRGCIRRCPECFVPEKEGYITPYRDIESVAHDRKEVILFDNNVLACDHGLKQIERIIELRLKVDFNQGMDARLIDDGKARLLSRVKWLSPIRLACDSLEMIEPVRKAVELLRRYDTKPPRFSCYVLIKELFTAQKRVEFLRSINVDPFAQVFINKNGDTAPRLLREFEHWVNMKKFFKTISFQQFLEARI